MIFWVTAVFLLPVSPIWPLRRPFLPYGRTNLALLGFLFCLRRGTCCSDAVSCTEKNFLSREYSGKIGHGAGLICSAMYCIMYGWSSSQDESIVKKRNTHVYNRSLSATIRAPACVIDKMITRIVTRPISPICTQLFPRAVTGTVL